MEFSSTPAFQECICSCLKAYINELIIGYQELATYVTLTLTPQNLEGIALYWKELSYVLQVHLIIII